MAMTILRMISAWAASRPSKPIRSSLTSPPEILATSGRKLGGDLLQGDQALLDGVAEQGSLDRGGVQAQVGHDRRHPEGMGQIRDAGGLAAPGVALAGQLEGAAHGGVGVGPGVALADPLSSDSTSGSGGSPAS